ncbi:unnamed protein product [Candidula unifasciata]|uniref:G-protein coupled receptors family 1 profile domain-containing protein n=1 Tax=Candidula unifasciata TaxID=100452 RepID=A0A8S3YCG4_9EUPU|nr:unnamed protein product [Candidula unifasciata]
MPALSLFTNISFRYLGNDPHVDKQIEEFIPEDIFVTSSDRRIAEICIELTLCFLMSLVGMVTNALVIVVFAKQKFKDSIAISMTAIAMWDFVKCVGCALQRFSGPISLWNPADAESWSNISIVVFTLYTCFATYVSIVLAAYVAVERCVCVSLPLKAKWLITRKSSFIICFVVSLVVFGWFSVMFCVYDIKWVYSFHYNRTIAIYINNDFFHRNKQPVFLFYNLSGVILPVVCFAIIVLCTGVIIYHLRKSSKFRTGSTQLQSQNSEKQSRNQISSRDRQVVKMLLVIIGVYVVCLSPRIAVYMAKYFVYDFYFLRRLHNLFMIFFYVVITFDLINAVINLFIFLVMSSSFRSTFLEIFPICNRLIHANNENTSTENRSKKGK